MADDKQAAQDQQPQTPPDAAQNTDSQADSTPQDNQHMIPKSRFDEVNNEMKALRDKLAKHDEAEQKRKEAEQLARGEHENVINELRPKAERADKLEAWVSGLIDAQLAAVPDEHKDSVNAILQHIQDPIAKHDALQAQLALLNAQKPQKAAPPSTDAGEGAQKASPKREDAEARRARLRKQFNLR